MERKRALLTFASLFLMLFASIMISSCTKEGPEGKPGLDGIDGKDGAESCSACHNLSEVLQAKLSQYSNSTHASGDNVHRNSSTCARCHTSMGFRNYIKDGTMATVDNPTPINCRTCHPIHETYTPNDYSIRKATPVTLAVGVGTYNYGNSNLCANCHEARTVTPYPVLGGTDVTITSSSYGAHYGPQSNMLAGIGPIQIPGSMTYMNSAHTTLVTGGCVTCHMSPATGNRGGGHTWAVKYLSASGTESYQYTGCLSTGCHASTSIVTALINPNRTEITALMDQLLAKLQVKGLLNSSASVTTPKTMTALQAAAVLNYKFVYGDHSYGAHNYRFSKALLVNSIESLN
ncbi:MAG: cytochrome c3 family protein [Bacteroidales bacterium]|nr:cytochrome c3 family protein [Bacteroidales bacterium]MDZ4205210.1 cytochrome c3 family protein [Bacteroidales bacterium]